MRYINTLPEDWTEFRAWVIEAKVKSDTEAWDKLQSPEWMLCLAEERGIELDTSKLRRFAADCADDVLHIYERHHPDDDRPRKAIQATRDYADGKIETDVRVSASAAASSASMRTTSRAAEYAARAASYAAAWQDDDAVSAAAWAATDAAAAVARDVASVSDEDSGDAAWIAAMSEQAKCLRKYFPNPFEEKP
jgi:hypothetical protein